MANIKWSAFTSGGDLQVGDQVVGLRAGDNRRFTFPSIGIKDASGNYLIGWGSTASAVNYIEFINSATDTSPIIIPTGTDTNIGLLLESKGNGNITLTPGTGGTVITSSALILNTSSPTTSLQAASKGYVDSVIPSFPVSLANGGTNASLTASNGGIFYSTSTAAAILSGTATATQMLQSGVSSAPAWSTTTWPATSTINQLLYSSATNTISGLSTANNGVLTTSNTGVPSILVGSGVTGNMLHSNSAAAPSWSTATYADTYSVNNILYASGANTVTGLSTANNGVLITGAGGIPSISSTLPSAVQSNITSLGTITSGVWNGTVISGQYGGTGVNNGASTITLGGSLTTLGAFASTFTMTGATNVTFPTSGTLATVGATITSITGTANQVLANGTSGSPQTGVVTLTLPQDIAASSTPAFNQLKLTGSILNPSGNYLLALSDAGSSSQNFVAIFNNTSGLPAILAANGTVDANVALHIGSKGAGEILFGTDLSTNAIGFKTGTSQQHTTYWNFSNTANTRTVTWQDADGTLAYLSDIPGTTPSALTKTDDANVTLTLGGTPATSLLQAVSLTLGWTGQLAVSRGGTGISSFGTGVATALGQNVIGTGAIALANVSTTWTPTLTFVTPGNLSVSYATQQGYYSQIGNLVVCSFKLICTPTYTTASGNLKISGLPVASNVNMDFQAGSVYVSSSNAFPTGTTSLACATGNASSFMVIVASGTAGSSTTFTTTHAATAVQILIQGTISYLT